MRVAVVDIGSNSTRVLVADVGAGGEIAELARESRVTRLGRGVDTSGRLAAEAIEETCATIADYLEGAGRLGAERIEALATSAVRDAANGDAFRAELRERFALDARVLDGLAEARLVYGGTRTGREQGAPTLVIDIGGGSTELIVGSGSEPSFHTSLQVGVVRFTERYLHADPPEPTELETLAGAVRDSLDAELAAHPGLSAEQAVAVAGTATQLAAIDLKLDPYDPDAVEGHELTLERIGQLCSQLAAVSLAERREIIGMHPGRAPTIVAGTVILIQALRAFGLDRVEVSEHDLLWGAALESARAAATTQP